jgi:hypothetical protein
MTSIHVLARVREVPTGYELSLELSSSSGGGRQILRADRCDTLVDVVALNVALASDPTTALTNVPSKPSAPPKVPSRNDGGTDYGVRVVGGVDFGILPAITPGISLLGLTGSRHVRFEAGATYWFPSRKYYAAVPDVSAEFDLLAGVARACGVATLGPVEVPLCAGFELGVLRGRGEGTAITETANRAWMGLVLGPAMTMRVAGPLFVWSQVDSVLSLARSAYRVRNLDILYTPPGAAARVYLGLSLRFW